MQRKKNYKKKKKKLGGTVKMKKRKKKSDWRILRGGMQEEDIDWFAAFLRKMDSIVLWPSRFDDLWWVRRWRLSTRQ